MAKKVLITGGAGFIGSNYAHYHFEKYPSDKVVVLDKLTYAGNLDNLGDLVKAENRFAFVQGDISDKKFIEDLFDAEKFDLVVNFAAETHVDRSITEPSVFVMTNVVGTHNLLEASRDTGVARYHQISTDEVYGDLGIGSKDFFTEKTSIAPNCPYAATKASADLLARSYFETFELPVTITRCSNNYGPYQFPEKIIPLAITNLLENKKVPVYGDGLYVRDWLYVEDHCKAIDLIIKKGKIGETYCVGGLTEDINNLSVIKKIIKILGKDDSYIEFVKDRPGHDRRYAIDWSKIKENLGWNPLHSFDEWLEKTAEWYKENVKWWQDVKNGEYKNYYKKQYGS